MESILPLLLWGGLFFVMMRFGCGSHLFGHRHGGPTGQGHEGHGGGHAHGCCGPTPGKVRPSGAEKATARSAVPLIEHHPRADHPGGIANPR